MKTSLDILKSWFQTGDKPTENQFANLLDSFHHKDDGNIIADYTIFDNGNVSFTFSDGKTAEIQKFVLPNTMPQNFIDGLVEVLNSKVNNEAGKQLSDENFTTVLKQKLTELENYIHPEFHEITDINGLQEAIESKVDYVEGKQLSDENFSSEEKEKLASLSNYIAPETKPISYIEELEETLTKINQDLEDKVNAVDGKQLSDENFSTEEKEKLANFNSNTFSSISDGENIITANGQADKLTFEGVTINVDEKIITINQPEIPTSLPISSIENLQEELDDLNTSLSEKIDSSELRNELDQVNEEINNKVDYEDLSNTVQEIEGNLEEKVERSDFSIIEDKINEIEGNLDDKLDVSEFTPTRDKINEIESNLDDKLDVSEFTPTRDKINEIENNLDDKLDVSEFTPTRDKINEIENNLDNKLDVSEFTPTRDKINEIESNLDDKLDVSEFTPTRDKINEIENNLDDKLNVSEFTPTRDKINEIESNLDDKLDVSEFTPTRDKINEIENNLDDKVDKESDKQLSSNDFTDKDKTKLANLSLNNFSRISDGIRTINVTKPNDQIIFNGATVNPVNNTITIDSTNNQNIFPEFNFSWGSKSRDYVKNYSNDPKSSYSGNVNLLECELINGSDDILKYDPKILLYRYKSKKKITYYDKVTNKPFLFTKKARFYHYEDQGKRNTVIPISSRKVVLDFGLEHFFKKELPPSNVLFAQGMKNSNESTLYRKKGRSQAHFYIKLRLQLTNKEKTILSPFSETLRVFIDQNEEYKISFERT
ncbi:hypothetical protein [Tenacibaculum jejuense]|uniref:Uncharacterized protein n=1 Tax=Tenacibaculum jejuense TaxID=584609 RepID=A0A238UBW1_9FLAO|nr:hypothetical protein [Tenacibaculum jejuense]SNR16545.1 protein of unknown function [Tenacibaculum jejuense]